MSKIMGLRSAGVRFQIQMGLQCVLLRTVGSRLEHLPYLLIQPSLGHQILLQWLPAHSSPHPQPAGTAHPLPCACTLSRSVMSNSLQPYRLQSTRFLCPWDSPGKNIGVSLGVGYGQGGLVCCNPWGRKESDMTEPTDD